ncbi:sn-glycerol-3-phosphate ABC transporter ATP-binding protein UgpC [Mesorhizobium sp. LHD-90]|uniref:ABC transporter ATP-binding protein n=1 Tax=Mesorhizobium sp. LHD-90 TaxID=3071414 RepID=UPI0027DECC58|nr:sn-glycerol-3-phosphate ABC transporter ATP-binding protein UgpC [Mesorhizobium sp. LHD-90]MDQ6434271.1 sn-glycerol-3-phosphate ABC transporter ATP-binding protein UgpC [Mesorhizobium sp. LHD-90]
MASVELRHLAKSFGRVEAVRDVSLAIGDRELVVFVGPSGCGKSTLLRMIAGLEEITSGELLIGGKPMGKVAAADRGIAMVFQSYALYPHMSVAENMGFALKMLGTPKAEIDAKVTAAAATLQLGELLGRKPRELSGGQRQRVAIGRAIVREPDVFLFDEPLSNLDAGLRAQMRVEIARLHAQLATTMIYVTHDQVEAMTLADRIVILNQGRIEQLGAPLELYERPANRFVAGFLGQPRMNFIPAFATPSEAGVALSIFATDRPLLRLGRDAAIEPGAAIDVGIRPDAITVSDRPAPEALAGTVVVVEHLGGSSLLYMQVDGVKELITVEQRGKTRLAAGQTAWLGFDAANVHLFGPDGRRIP